ncbi:hypothetical protein JRO89_XS06G0257800 [Xanthoceras sorbifolium]|uniref:Gag protein n=1 Tax=Xanthoceras sorbifolium TaxID=99658 RepID=A0ABQ8HZE2_9ROSI|nr:hypothetical protein JRO89_XS06G0257800 [Xanthoceras sorbifolium]
METPSNKSQTSVTSPAIISSPTNLMTQSNLVPANGNLISLNASSQIPFKLMTNLLFGYGLFDFVDGSRPYPSQTNPGYLFWIRQDRFVLLAIQATVHSTISPTINNCTTSADAWNKLETSYANRSNTRMLYLMSYLMSKKKEGKTVAAYMSRGKSLVDDLALIGHPLNNAQIMSYTLNGLVNEFKELTAAVRPKEEETQVTAQLAQKRSNYRSHGGRGNRGNQNTTTHDSFGQYPQPDHTQSNQQQSSYGRVQAELRRQGVKDIPSTMAAVEGLVDLRISCSSPSIDKKKPIDGKKGKNKDWMKKG